jgi:2,4-diaminopentanoate dehydrogenase
MFRIVHWGTGNIGSLVLPLMLERPDLKIVGHYVYDPQKIGKDTGELAGVAPIGVKATQDIDALIALKPDVLVYFGNAMFDPLGTARIFARFLRAGVNIVTTGLYEIGSRDVTPKEFLEILEPACKEGNSSVYSTGADPGFATTQLALTTLAVAHRVDEIHMQEFASYGDYPDEKALRYFMGYGGALDATTPLTQGDFQRRCWTSAVYDIAHALGLAVDEYRVAHRMAPALKDRETKIGRIDRGTVSVIWLKLIGVVAGMERVVLEHINWMHVDDVPHDWPQPPRYRGKVTGLGYRIVIDGDPTYDFEMQIPGVREGLMATGLHAINAIPLVVRSKAGIVDLASLPLYAPAPLKRRGAIDR